jgi:hypothetical protein
VSCRCSSCGLASIRTGRGKRLAGASEPALGRLRAQLPGCDGRRARLLTPQRDHRSLLELGGQPADAHWWRLRAAIAAIRSPSAAPRAADASRTASPNQLSEISIPASSAAATSPPYLRSASRRSTAAARTSAWRTLVRAAVASVPAPRCARVNLAAFRSAAVGLEDDPAGTTSPRARRGRRPDRPPLARCCSGRSGASAPSTGSASRNRFLPLAALRDEPDWRGVSMRISSWARVTGQVPGQAAQAPIPRRGSVTFASRQ